MKTSELVVLAGGYGTRIRESLPGLPKALAPIGDKTFLDYLIRYYQKQGIERFIFCLGVYKGMVIDHIESFYSDIEKVFVCEDEPLGTGGAIRNGLLHSINDPVLIVNGDTYFAIDLDKATAFHLMCGAECTVVLKPMDNTERYGSVDLSNDYRLAGFQEKGVIGAGLINAGAYLLNKQKFLENNLPEKFSFEKEYLEKHFEGRRIFGLKQDRFFIDIGIPEDLAKAQTEIIAYDSRLDQAN